MRKKLDIIKELLAQDKRRTERILPALEVSYALVGKKTWRKPESIKDISGGGINLIDSQAMRKNTRLTVRIEFPRDPEPIEIPSTVVWNKKIPATKNKTVQYAIGLRFERMKHEDRQRFISYITESILSLYINNAPNPG